MPKQNKQTSVVTKKPSFNVVVKVDNTRFIKWRGVTNFNSMINYLDRTYRGWRWFNYYSRISPYPQIGSYSHKSGYRLKS